MAETANTSTEVTASIKAWAEVEMAADKTEPRAVAVRYDPAAGLVMLTLKSGAIVGVPPSALSIPDGATPEQLQAGEIDSNGEHVYWHEIDGGDSVPGAIMHHLFGHDFWRIWSEGWENRYDEAKARILAEMRAKGGRSKSPAKATASRENGKKGGRPRKLPPASGE